jgi:uncharacterized damage-inducible protein DinB
MDSSALEFLLRFNIWANRRLLDAIESLSGNADLTPIRDMVAHIVAAEWIWMERLEGVSPGEVPAWVDAEGLEPLRERLAVVETRRTAFLESLDESGTRREVEFRLLNGSSGTAEVWQLMVHVINHSTYHRGQLARLLREAGVTPPTTDLISFCPEGGQNRSRESR